MFKPSAPREYVTGEYLEYQKKYAKNIRESDKVLIRLIRKAVQGEPPRAEGPRLLDIGCSNGNLLLHLKNALPGVEYFGGDLFPEIVEHCRNNPDLAGVPFEVMDIRDLGDQPRFDMVVANAILSRFRDDEFARSISAISRVTRPGGWFFTFEWFHPFEQEVEIFERSGPHPEGLTLIFRPYSRVAGILKQRSYRNIEFHPFSIPIDLPKPNDPGDISTYTIRTDDGERLNFRGCLYLPWCHVVARKE
jgi:SAM-dependent methyltransferase